MSRNDSWTAAVDALLARVEGLTQREAAAKAGVSPATLQRWRTARERREEIPEPRGDPRGVLVQEMKRSGSWPAEESGEQAMHVTPHEAAVREIDRTVRYLGGLEELDEEERRLRQIDYLEGVIRLHREAGNEVRPLLELMGRVVLGELITEGKAIFIPDPRKEQDERRTG